MLQLNSNVIFDQRKEVIFISIGTDGYKLEDSVSIFIFQKIVNGNKIDKKTLINMTVDSFLDDFNKKEQIVLEIENFIDSLLKANILVLENAS